MQRPVNAAATGKTGRFVLRLVIGGILLALGLAVVTLRLQRLSELPPGLAYDEGAHGVDALRVLQGEHAVFFPESHGREGLIVYAVALTTSFLGRTILAVRLPTALASAGTVFIVFWLGWLLFGSDEKSGRATPWRGLLVGGVGAGLLAVSLSQTVIGRTAFRANFVPLLFCLSLALLWGGWRCRSRRRIALAGVCAGLLAYTYIAARFTPFLFLFFGLSFLFPLGRSRNGVESSEGVLSRLTTRVRVELPLASVFVGVAGAVATPILFYFVLHPDQFFVRSNQLLVFQTDGSQGGPLWALLLNVWNHLLAFGFRGDPSMRHNYSGQPMLNTWEALFFWLGVGMALWRWQRPAYRLLLLWLGLLLLPAMLSKDENVPHFLRMIGAAPAIYLLAGIGVWETHQFFRGRFLWERVKSAREWGLDETKVSILVGFVVGGVILVQGALTYRAYFQTWAEAPEIRRATEAQQWQELDRVLRAQPPAVDMAYLIPSYAWHYSFEYLYDEAAPDQVIYLAPSNLTQKIESTLEAMEKVGKVKFVDWDNGLVGGDATAEEHFVVLLGKYGRFLGSEVHGSFQVHNYIDMALDRPWTIYEYLEPLTVHFDGGISLHGLAMGQGEEQLSPHRPFILGEEHALWVALQWQTAPGLDIDYSISLRLHNAEGRGVYQTDEVLWNEETSPTSLWLPENMVDTTFYLEIPTDLPPGEYELRLVVYDFETLNPTVELGVWEPETILARLKLAEAD